MELLFVVLIGVVIGLLGRGVLPGSRTTGVVLLPAVGGAAAAVVWVALTWSRMRWDGGLIWWLTIAATVLTVTGLCLVLARIREREDDALFDRVSRGG